MNIKYGINQVPESTSEKVLVMLFQSAGRMDHGS
jgi:hypothetical protein